MQKPLVGIAVVLLLLVIIGGIGVAFGEKYRESTSGEGAFLLIKHSDPYFGIDIRVRPDGDSAIYAQAFQEAAPGDGRVLHAMVLEVMGRLTKAEWSPDGVLWARTEASDFLEGWGRKTVSVEVYDEDGEVITHLSSRSFQMPWSN